MKVKELIRRLQEADPTGEIEACVGNIDIHFVSREPAYYDGRLEVLKRDPARTGRCYDICGAEIRNDGQKVQIHTLSIREAIWEDPDLPVTPDGDCRVTEWRQEARENET
jgi:hypothetical protein